MSDNKHIGRGAKGKGYYIALILCAAAIGISGYVYYRNANQEEQPQLQAAVSDAVVATEPQEDLPVVVIEPQEVLGKDVETPAATEPATVPTMPKRAIKTAAPVTGQTVSAYAVDCLSYNQTTRDWRVHNGVDIAAEEGTEVLAAADGTVYTVYNDDTMGTTVVIRHDGGYTTTYSSLAEELKVGAGDAVRLGQAIGCVGSTALVETAVGPHVHFSVTYQDERMDPAEFLSLGQE